MDSTGGAGTGGPAATRVKGGPATTITAALSKTVVGLVPCEVTPTVRICGTSAACLVVDQDLAVI